MTTLIYRNRESGKETTFDMEDYPKDTLQWEFVTSESKLLKRGYEPPIHDFAIMDEFGYDLVDEILSDKGYSLIMVSYDLKGADQDALINAREWSQLEIFASEFSFYAVTSTTSAEVESISTQLDLGYQFMAGDEIMLKTIVRSNPGFMLVKNGAILGKWAFRDFPALEQLDPNWSELIGNASAPMDEETQLLMDAGAYDDFSFDVIEFERFIPELVWKEEARRRETGVELAFILSIVAVVFLSGYISPLRL